MPRKKRPDTKLRDALDALQAAFPNDVALSKLAKDKPLLTRLEQFVDLEATVIFILAVRACAIDFVAYASAKKDVRKLHAEINEGVRQLKLKLARLRKLGIVVPEALVTDTPAVWFLIEPPSHAKTFLGRVRSPGEDSLARAATQKPTKLPSVVPFLRALVHALGDRFEWGRAQKRAAGAAAKAMLDIDVSYDTVRKVLPAAQQRKKKTVTRRRKKLSAAA